MHVAKPEELSDEDLQQHVARVKWLLNCKYVYGVETKFDSLSWRPEQELIDELNKEFE